MYKLQIPKKINVEKFFIKKNLNWLVDLSKLRSSIYFLTLQIFKRKYEF